MFNKNALWFRQRCFLSLMVLFPLIRCFNLVYSQLNISIFFNNKVRFITISAHPFGYSQINLDTQNMLHFSYYYSLNSS